MSEIGNRDVPYGLVGEVFVGYVVVDVLGSTRRVRPRPAKGRVQIDLGVEVEPEGGEVSSEGEGDEIGVCLRRADEGQEADHAVLVSDH